MPTLKNLITAALVVVALATGTTRLAAQDNVAVYRLQQGENHLDVYQQFTTLIEHSARIRSVLDFDSDVVKIEVVQGNPHQIRLFALAPGVTTVTIRDEFDQYFRVEVLVEGDVRHLQSILRRLFPDDDIRASEVKGAVLLTGWVTQPGNITEIVEIAEQFYATVINQMDVGGAQQVQLKCEILEVQRSKIRRLGLNFQFSRPEGYLVSTPGPITPIQTLNPAANPAATLTSFAESTLTFGFIQNNRIFQGFVRALREEGLLKIHAQPHVTTLNGQPAELLNGGETPVIVPAGLGTTAIEFKQFGVRLDAVPHILGNGRLRLQVKPEVSERDFSNAVTVGGVTVPAFTVRRASTEVEMNFGETLVIAGLISQREDATVVGIPGLGKLPWIGAAFSGKRYTESETELIILVTPEHTAPMSPEQVPPGGPGLFTDTPTDRELFFHNLIEVPKYGDECQMCTTCLQGGSRRNGCRECQKGTDCVKVKPKAATRPGVQSRMARKSATKSHRVPEQKQVAVPAGFTSRSDASDVKERTVEPTKKGKTTMKDRPEGLIAPATQR